MIKYDKSKSLYSRNERGPQTSQKKTHLERKAQSKNSSFQIDLSKRQLDTDVKQKKPQQQLGKSVAQSPRHGQQSRQDSVMEDSLTLKSPITTIRDSSSGDGNTLTVKKLASPGIISGRLTIKSITNLDNSAQNIDAESEIETKRSEFKAQLLNTKSKSTVNKSMLVQSQIHTPFAASPVKPFNQEIIMEASNEKLRAPVIKKSQQANYNTDSNEQGIRRGAKGGKHEQLIGLVSKGQKIKQERDSLILKEKKERDSDALLLQKDDDLFDPVVFSQQRSLLNNQQSDSDDECPPLSPVSKLVNHSSSSVPSSEERLPVRQIQFNLISSLMGSPQTRSSFISRASNKMKNYSSNSSQVTNRRSGCSHKCGGKGIKSLFNCCNAGYNITNRSKVENSSVYSNGSAFNKVLQNNFNGGSSFINNRSPSNLYLRTEDFSDDVDEYENDQVVHRLSLVKRKNVNCSMICQPGIKIREPAKPLTINQSSPQQPQQPQKQDKKSKLDSLVTKMPMSGVPQNQQQVDIQSIQVDLSSTQTFQNANTQGVKNNSNDDSLTNSSAVLPQDIHRLHFLQTIQALHTIKNVITMPEEHEIEHLKVDLPPSNKKKTLIFDMDETLIHCVDDIEVEDPDIIIPIDFPDEDELVNAGVNIRPYIYECLEEAKKYFQIIVFTASHKAYADAILDYLDPENKYFEYRMYRDNCVQTKEGYYVKDLRVIRNRDLRDVVIIDNSVFSFSFQIDNGIPIIPFYADKEDEEMLHLIYYLNCLVDVDDVRGQNREAFELRKLQQQSPYEIINNYYTTNNQQQLLLQNSEDAQEDLDRIIEENEETQEILSEDDNNLNNNHSQQQTVLKQTVEHQQIKYSQRYQQ